MLYDNLLQLHHNLLGISFTDKAPTVWDCEVTRVYTKLLQHLTPNAFIDGDGIGTERGEDSFALLADDDASLIRTSKYLSRLRFKIFPRYFHNSWQNHKQYSPSMPSTARSRPSATASRQSNGPTPLPAYQPALHPLNESGQRALQSLHREHNLESLKRKLQIANNHLTTAAADVNDRLHTQENNYGKYKKRLEKEGSQADDQQDELIAEARQKADEMTGRLEEGVRKIIDSDAEVEGVERALKELQDNVSTGRGRIVPTQSTLGASQFRSNDRRRRGDTQDEGDGDSEFGDDPNRPLGDQENIVGVLKRKVADQKSEYEALSMAQR